MLKMALAIVIIFVFGLVINPPVLAQHNAKTHLKSGKRIVCNTTADSFKRKFILHLPADYNPKETYPLLLCFHGNGGTGKLSEKAGFSDIADREGFIVVYPYGVHKTWNLASLPGLPLTVLKDSIPSVPKILRQIIPVMIQSLLTKTRIDLFHWMLHVIWKRKG